MSPEGEKPLQRRGEFEVARSLMLAGTALGAIRRHDLCASPANYAFWYACVAGTHPQLKAAVDELIAAQGKLTQKELDRLSERHMPDAGHALESIGEGIGFRIADVIQWLDGAVDSSATYSTSLTAALGDLAGAKDEISLGAVVRVLGDATARVARDSKQLSERLDASLKEVRELKVGLETVREESQRDALTGLSNRKFFSREIDRLVAHARQSGSRLSLLMIDIDHFKAFNDTYGHLTGDQVIRLVARTIAQNVKGRDIAARYGGEEFVVALPDTPLQPAAMLADKIRVAVAANELRKKSTGERLGSITVSIGVAELLCGDTCESLIERADDCLYEAKRSGRDRVVHEQKDAASTGLLRAS